MSRHKKFLKEGEQTKATASVKRVAASIEGSGFDYVINVLDWLDENLKEQKEDKMKIFRKRTATEIIESGSSTGCTDHALVFIAIARAKGIPTKYVEGIKRRWLESDTKTGKVEGHVFAEVYLNGKWYVVDPSMGAIYINRKIYRSFEIFGTGLDAWDLGLSSFEELREKFTKFKESRKKSHKKARDAQ